jgi:hypothetical protein
MVDCCILLDFIDQSIDPFNSIVLWFWTFLVHRYLAQYYVNDKKIKVQILRQNQISSWIPVNHQASHLEMDWGDWGVWDTRVVDFTNREYCLEYLSRWMAKRLWSVGGYCAPVDVVIGLDPAMRHQQTHFAEVLYAYKTYLNGKTVVHLYLQIWFTHRSRQDSNKTEVVNIYSHNIWDPTFVK